MYKITITKTDKEEYVAMEYQKIAETGNSYDNKAQYGYVEKGKETRNVETVIYTQNVETLDLPEVIKAINKIS